MRRDLPVRGVAALATEAVPRAGDARPDWTPAVDQDGSRITLGPPQLHGSDQIEDGWFWSSTSHEVKTILAWMAAREDSWALWTRLYQLFGGEVLKTLIVDTALADAERARQAEEARGRQQELQDLLRDEIELSVLDPKGRKPGLSLKSGDATKPFFLMRFTERWERDRVVDWLQWQEESYLQYRNMVEEEGELAVERAILAAMREFEIAARKRGISSGGRRPLRFWRGE